MGSDAWTMLLVLGIFTLATTVVVVVIWQAFATWPARATLAREREYRALAETAVATQEKTERRLEEVTGQLAEIRDRVTALERLLREVE
ncbi:hypothetical protein [Plantactinospora sp. KLBMP9567]|uniref:hypothetical protein n=1 Tax=Plantactinospora sp. KLBMP9567 TaxID=3085900 RepID=UPI00298108D6|nr:hypothetical protein [Plantactinospora sp. KLBMP9567]MDW5324813.1 hypothetical protein [Plantactinospora sp. KLBMP9567]MDW5330576.1 hypothetical protein [Plantactinospora sp. KLBMP9567]